MERTAAAILVGVVLLAGCSASPAAGPRTTRDLEGGAARAGFVPAEIPIHCDASRPAVAHHAGANVTTYLLAHPIYPCLSKTGAISREPTIGISSKGTVFHYPAMTGDNTKPTGVAVSQDNGTTWKLVVPTMAGQPTHPTSTDPYLYLDPTTDRVFADDLLTPNCSYFSWSDNEGQTWSNSLSGCLEFDHQTIFAGKPVTSQTQGYRDVVYRCAINLVALGGASAASTCQKSLDGGLTWQPFGQPAYLTSTDQLPNHCDGALGHGIADAKGRIYLPKGQCGAPQLAISADEGATWRRFTVASNGVRGHETGVGVDPDGNIYYTYTASDEHPYLTASRDDGKTWSKPLMIGAPDVTHAVFPELIVGGVGKIAWVYMGSANGNPDAPQTYDAYLGVSYDALSENPTFYSATVNDPVKDAFVVGACCGGVQDFIDVRVGPDGTPWGAFVDDCLGPGTNCATATEALDTHREGAVGWMWGGPSLWDASDPNGPYPNPG